MFERRFFFVCPLEVMAMGLILSWWMSWLGRELDFDDLYNTPADGNRYEILDGALITTPAPRRPSSKR